MRIIAFVLFITLISCKSQTNDLQIRREVLSIVKEISKENMLAGSAVGYLGKQPKQWNRFIALQEKATDDELITLTNHENGVVRCYAFQALAMRNSENCFDIVKKHLTDSSLVRTFFGCIIDEEMVGDYFISCVYPSFNENSYLLTDQQKSEIDSILLYNDSIKLSNKDFVLRKLPLSPIHYERVKEIVIKENNLYALIALAKYQNPNDISIIKKHFEIEENLYWTIYAVREYPDISFYSYLLKIFEQEWSETLYDYPLWRILYQALAKYPTDKTMELFERTITEGDDFRKQTLGKYLMIAITKYPNEIYESIKDEIKLDDFDISEIPREMSIED